MFGFQEYCPLLPLKQKVDLASTNTWKKTREFTSPNGMLSTPISEFHCQIPSVLPYCEAQWCGSDKGSHTGSDWLLKTEELLSSIFFWKLFHDQESFF